MRLEVLPLAITMMAGPQVISAVIFVTSERPVTVSLAFIAAIFVGCTLGVTLTWGISELLGNKVDFGDPSDSSSGYSRIQIVLVALLILLALRAWRTRETAKPPKWLSGLMSADEKHAFVAGLAMITIFPSDAVVLTSVGFDLSVNGADPIAALPFLLATTLIAAVPLLAYLLFGARAKRAMPKARDWMHSHSWVLNIAASCIFITLILS